MVSDLLTGGDLRFHLLRKVRIGHTSTTHHYCSVADGECSMLYAVMFAISTSPWQTVFGEESVCLLICELGLALEYLQKQRVVHRLAHICYSNVGCPIHVYIFTSSPLLSLSPSL